MPQIHRYHRQRLFPAKPLRQIVTKASFFSLPSTRYFMYQSFEPLGLSSRLGPELSVILKDFSVGLILRIAVSVNAMGGGSIYSTNREAPIKPKNYGCQKTRQTLSDQPGKDNFLFFNTSPDSPGCPETKIWLL